MVNMMEDETRTCANKARAARQMLAALRILLPVAQAFERQASSGSAGRRGDQVFKTARAAIAAAEAAGIKAE